MTSLEARTRAIVIVHDAPERFQSLCDCLNLFQDRFPVVVQARDCEEALEAVTQYDPVCCMVDYAGFVAQGSPLLTKLRQRRSTANLPVVLCVKAEEEEQAASLLPDVAQDYLTLDDLTGPRVHRVLCTISEARTLHNKIQHLEHFDSLTGLLNRDLLINRLELALRRCDRYQQQCAVIRLTLKNFKPVNDAYGQSSGDQLLQAVADRLRTSCRSTDSAARFGGDEFVVLLEQVDANTGAKVADKIVKNLAEPFEINGHRVGINVSVGVAIYPDTARSAETLLKQADQALARARGDNFSPVVLFSETHKQQWDRQHVLERALPSVIANGELALAYQPIVKADTFELRRLEVLTRWPRDDYAVNPLELMDMIDRLNLMEAFHDWLFQSAFQQMKCWREEAIHPGLCLNIPANYCYSKAISRCIIGAIERNGISPDKVELEITESTLMRFPERSSKVLQGLHERGLRIAIDDFGTGYSSMSYLTRLPLDTLKIDRNFFLAEDPNVRNQKIIEAIAALGHGLGLEIIAEGVETQRELAIARSVGCDLLQGYYFGKPAFPGACWNDYLQHFEHIVVPGK